MVLGVEVTPEYSRAGVLCKALRCGASCASVAIFRGCQKCENVNLGWQRSLCILCPSWEGVNREREGAGGFDVRALCLVFKSFKRRGGTRRRGLYYIGNDCDVACSTVKE